jgi:hypothetical protein
MGLRTEQISTEFVKREKGEEEIVGKGSNQEEFETVIPGPKTRGFKGKLRLGVASSYLDRPAAHISPNEVPGLTSGKHGLVGKEVAGLATFALTRGNQPKLDIGQIRVGDWCGIHTDQAVGMGTAIEDLEVCPTALTASELPGLAFVMRFITEEIVLRPAHHKADVAHECRQCQMPPDSVPGM